MMNAQSPHSYLQPILEAELESAWVQTAFGP